VCEFQCGELPWTCPSDCGWVTPMDEASGSRLRTYNPSLRH